MANSQEELLAELEDRREQLISLCNILKRRNEVLRNEVEQKNKVIEALSMDAGQLKTQYDNLRFAKAYSSKNKEEVQNAKQRLSKLVHDVEKCIALLKV